MIYKDSLEKLGYKLQDFGNHWRTKAIYRNGTTETSLIIYKDSGVWRDFGSTTEPLPFELLVRKTLKTDDPKIIREYVSTDNTNITPQIIHEKIQMEKIYPKEMLEKLLPIRNFYENRKISAETQKEFDCGYCGNGKMYRRMVFPIFNLDKQIHGFSGRLVSEDANSPKWKHIGKKNNWIYPNHLSARHIEEKREVILVESIGDCLALYESGYKNVLVTFGLDISASLISFLNSFELSRIIVSLNNDKNKEVNSGSLGSIRILAKLSSFFDLNLLEYNPPMREVDFGDMLINDVDFDAWYARTSKWNMSDEDFQSRIKNKILSTDSLMKSGCCKKLLKIL